MTTSSWGPLDALVGVWESGPDGVDVSFHADQGKTGETRFRERTVFERCAPVHAGRRLLHGLEYRTATWRLEDDEPLHNEVGYLMYDAERGFVVRAFIVPHATALLAGGPVEADAHTLRLSALDGSSDFGILSSFLTGSARTTRFDVTMRVDGDTLSYEQTTAVEYGQPPTLVMHTDRNTLTRVTSTR